MRRALLVVAVFAAGFAANQFTRKPAPKPDPNWPSAAPETMVVSRPAANGRETHSLRVTRLGTSHKSDGLDPAAWRVVFATPRGTWFAECAHVHTDPATPGR